MNPGLYPNPRAHLFVSAEYPLAAGLVAEVEHGLRGTPQSSEWVLVCKVAENGHPVGRELDVDNFTLADNDDQAFTTGRDAVAVALTMNASAGMRALSRTTGNQAAFTPANWRAKCYAYYFGP